MMKSKLIYDSIFESKFTKINLSNSGKFMNNFVWIRENCEYFYNKAGEFFTQIKLKIFTREN